MSPQGDRTGGLPVPAGAEQGPGPGAGGGYPSQTDSQRDPRSEMATMLTARIVQAARQLGDMYPATLEEMRFITNVMARAQQKMVMSRPAPEVSAPPV